MSALCEACNGPCRVPSWANDGSWYTNDGFGQHIAVVHFHRALTPTVLEAVAYAVEEIRALRRRRTYPCVGCGKFAFATRGVRCFWCSPRATLTPIVADVANNGRPSLDDLKLRERATRYDKRKRQRRQRGA